MQWLTFGWKEISLSFVWPVNFVHSKTGKLSCNFLYRKQNGNSSLECKYSRESRISIAILYTILTHEQAMHQRFDTYITSTRSICTQCNTAHLFTYIVLTYWHYIKYKFTNTPSRCISICSVYHTFIALQLIACSYA